MKTFLSKTSLFRISYLIKVDLFNLKLKHNPVESMHLPVGAECPFTSTGLHANAMILSAGLLNIAGVE